MKPPLHPLKHIKRPTLLDFSKKLRGCALTEEKGKGSAVLFSDWWERAGRKSVLQSIRIAIVRRCRQGDARSGVQFRAVPRGLEGDPPNKVDISGRPTWWSSPER